MASTGSLSTFFVVPLPSWPALLLPQPQTWPFLSRAVELEGPALMEVTGEEGNPLTLTGFKLSVVVPFPNWPSLFWLQASTAPLARR